MLRFAQNDRFINRVHRKIRIFWEIDESKKLRVFKFIFGHPSCHSAQRTSLSGVAETKIGF